MATLSSFTTVGISTGTSIVITKPTGLAVGDELVAIFGFTQGSGGTDINTPAGWTVAVSGDLVSNSHRTKSFRKTADSADVAASNFTFTLTQSSIFGGCLCRITNFGVIVGTSSVTSTDTSSPSPLTMTSITPSPVRSNLLLIVASGGFGPTAGTTPSMGTVAIATSNPTWTEQSDFSDAAQDVYFAFATATRSQDTATGSITAVVNNPSSNTTSDYSAICMAIAPKLGVPINPAASFANTTSRTVIFPGKSSGSSGAVSIGRKKITNWQNVPDAQTQWVNETI